MIGKRLAHYEITRHLGTGGMGEVYQATDAKLGREVAIKLLPEAFAQDVERMARFEREARILASLNHPNIAAIHGFEVESGRTFLVMELVPGETLAQRVKRGAIPLPEALRIAGQITEALEAAHEKGIVHRDLKPANIKVTTDGKVKVLDFGLAKAFESDSSNSNLSNSPTMSTAGTLQGVILGTAAYMSPEQAKGRVVDRRTDIFAFGAVLYEMLTGHQAFGGEDVTDILSRVLQREPEWKLLPATVSPRIRELLRLCLQKDARMRRQTATDVRIDIEQSMAEPLVAGPARGSRLSWIIAAAAGLVAVMLAIPAVRHFAETPSSNTTLRLSAELGADVSLATDESVALALSGDGKMLTYVGKKAGTTQLYLRHLDQFQSVPLAGTDGAREPFFSWDGKWIAFFADGHLMKISVSGGMAMRITDAKYGMGGAWGEDDYIVFTPGNGPENIVKRVSSRGGDAKPVTTLGALEMHHFWPQILPGAIAVLYTPTLKAENSLDNADIMVQPLPKGVPKKVLSGGYSARYLRSGYIVYIQAGTLWAVPFSLDQLAVTGPHFEVVEGVSGNADSGRAQFAVSDAGVLAYAPGQNIGGDGVTILSMDSDGKTTPLVSRVAHWNNPQFSRDGTKLAMDLFDGKQYDIWVGESALDNMKQLTFDASDETNPVWTRDGKRVVFASNRRDKSVFNLYWQRADGAGQPQPLTESKNTQLPGSFDPTGKYLVFSERNPQSGTDFMILQIEGDESSSWKPQKPIFFFHIPDDRHGIVPMFSPDGRWIAFQSNKLGHTEVFVRSYPSRLEEGWQASMADGGYPVWSRSRDELFYITLDGHIMVVPYSVDGETFKPEKALLWSEQALKQHPSNRSFDLHRDGKRIAIFGLPKTQTETPHDSALFIFNLLEELRRIAPPGKP